MMLLISPFSILAVAGFTVLIHSCYYANEGFEDENGCHLLGFVPEDKSAILAPSLLASGEALLLK